MGFATWRDVGGIVELEDLFVDPGWKRRGIAVALVDRIARVQRERGVKRVVVTANPHALGFYRAAGFIDCGVANAVFGPAPRMARAIPECCDLIMPLPWVAALLRPASAASRVRTSASGAEVLGEPLRVEVLPRLAGILGCVLLVEADQHVDKLAADGTVAEQLGQL